MKVLLIVNPAASSVTARTVVRVRQILAASHDLDVHATLRRGHATELAADAARNGMDAVVVLGGDGTLNEAANGLVGSQCALAALPGGSTNVFARTLGLPYRPTHAAAVTARSLTEHSVQRIGVGSINERHFLFHTGIGWDARLVRDVERHASLKRVIGHALFVYAGLRTWLKLWDRSVDHFRIRFTDGQSVSGKFVVIMNTNPYTYVGRRPFNITLDATFDRPLAVVCLTEMRAGSFLRLIRGSLTTPDAPTRSSIVAYRCDVTDVTIEAIDGPVPVQVDGDDIGDHASMHLRFEPDALSIVIPVESERPRRRFGRRRVSPPSVSPDQPDRS